MSLNIDVAELANPRVESMAYRYNDDKDIPWFESRGFQGLGTRVTRDQSNDEWLASAGIDWKVQRRKVYMRDTAADIYATHEIPNQIAITRASDGKVFAIKTDDYHPYQNKDVISFFREWTEAGEMSIHTLGSLKGGNLIWVMASIGKSFTLPGNDKILGNILLSNAHDGTLSFQGQDTDLCVVCFNTWRAAKKGEKTRAFRIKHSRAMSPALIADAKRQLGLALDRFTIAHETAQELSESKVSEALTLSYLSQLGNGSFLLDSIVEESENLSNITTSVASGTSLLDTIVDSPLPLEKKIETNYKNLSRDSFNRAGKAILDAITSSPGSDLESRKGTLWGVVNGVTHYVDHTAGRTEDSRLTNAWFGPRSNLKDEAVQLAVDFARVK